MEESSPRYERNPPTARRVSTFRGPSPFSACCEARATRDAGACRPRVLRGVALISAITISGCSLILGKPATLGWPSGDPDDYAYQQSYNCYVYDKTVPIDMVIAIAGTAIAITGLILRDDGREIGKPIAIGAGVVTAPFIFSSIAGGLGRSRCYRWAREIPLMPYGGSPPPVPMGNEGSGAPGEPDGPPAGPAQAGFAFSAGGAARAVAESARGSCVSATSARGLRDEGSHKERHGFGVTRKVLPQAPATNAEPAKR